MEIVGEAYVYGTDDWLKYLEGEGFCTSPSLGLTEEQIFYPEETDGDNSEPDKTAE